MARQSINTAEARPLIAVVDDDQSVLNSVARLLRSVGYAVATFSTGPEFLGSIATSSPRCLVLDVQMPDMNGLELQTRLTDLGHQMPVVFITANDSPQTRAIAIQSGVLDVFLKPFEEKALLAAIGKAVEKFPVRPQDP